jgi:hypothetical protein
MTTTFNQAAVTALFQAMTSEAMGLGAFARVNGHEPKSAPGVQISFSLWLASIRPVATSGLNSVSGVVTFTGRVYKASTGANQTELDAIDPAILTATGQLMAAYSGGFTLGGTVRAVDLLGAAGTPMAATAVYVEQDGKQFRVMELTIPVVINDLWQESA